MKRTALLKLIAAGLLVAASVWAGDPLRIDASSDATARDSWARMLASADANTRQQLQFAMLKINLMGVRSAREIAGGHREESAVGMQCGLPPSNPCRLCADFHTRKPEFDTLGIERIKDRVAGMSAAEVIALGERNRDLRIEAPR